MEKQFIREQDLLEDSYRLGVDVFNSGFRPSVVVGLWRGGSTVGIYVQECLQTLGVDTRHIAVRTSYEGPSSYQRMHSSGADIGVHGLRYLYQTLDYEDRLLIVDDVYSTGRNIEAVISKLRRKTRLNMASDTRVATIWRRSNRDDAIGKPDYHLHDTDRWLVLPYELSDLSTEEIAANKAYVLPMLEQAKKHL